MKYKCIPCDHVFEAPDGAKPRCPRCLKIHDIEPVAEDASAGRPRRSSRVIAPLVLVGLVVALVGLYLGLSDKPSAPAGKPAEPDLDESLSALEAAGKPSVNPFASSPKIERFAKANAAGRSGADALQALFDAISKMRADGRWKPHHQREPRLEEPLTAEELLARLEKGPGGKPYPAESYELACLLLAAARSIGVGADLASIFSFSGERSPADPYGKLGRFGVVPKDSTTDLFDPYGGRSGASAKADWKRLDDRAAAAPYFALKALSELVKRDTSSALALNEVAIGLDGANPYFRVGRGLIFAASAAPGEALAEFEKAVKVSGDAVMRTNLGEILLLADPSGRRAEGEVQAALTAMPDYSRAHAVLAMVHLIRQEIDEAKTELALAERLDPASPVVAIFAAELHAALAEADEAIAKANEAVRLSEESLSSLLALAGVYRRLSRFEEMRRTLDRVAAVDPSPGLAAELKSVFGYDPTDKTAIAGPAGAPDGGLAAPGKLDLQPGKLELKLGGGQGQPGLGGKGPRFGSGLDLDLKVKQQ